MKIEIWQDPIDAFQDYLQEKAQILFAVNDKQFNNKLSESINYSLKLGGKRFRPLLCMLTATDFASNPKRVLPWALAVEMVHTYSLIHDDLPCMDNDDLRRGLPSNHKVFGEATALLAGDALLTEAFGLISNEYSSEPNLANNLVILLARSAGVNGMITGQAQDLDSKERKISFQEIQTVHQLKTGALIVATVEGAALALGLKSESALELKSYGHALGLAFQIKDDLLDEAKNEANSYLSFYNRSEVVELLNEQSHLALSALKKLKINESGHLAQLIEYNLKREN